MAGYQNQDANPHRTARGCYWYHRKLLRRFRAYVQHQHCRTHTNWVSPFVTLPSKR